MDELLTRILNDTAEREDVRKFGEWIRQEENKAYFETFKKVWHLSSGVQCDDRSVESGWQDYKRFMISSRRKEIPFLLRKTWKYAAAIVVLVSAYWFFGQERTKETVVNVAEYVDISMENAEIVSNP